MSHVAFWMRWVRYPGSLRGASRAQGQELVRSERSLPPLGALPSGAGGAAANRGVGLDELPGSRELRELVLRGSALDVLDEVLQVVR